MATFPNFKTIEEIKAFNEEKGKYFFSKDTMKFFNSKVETSVYGGVFFVTSERMELDRPKRYTVRQVEESGNIKTIGSMQQYSTLASARDEAKRLAKLEREKAASATQQA